MKENVRAELGLRAGQKRAARASIQVDIVLALASEFPSHGRA